MISSTILEFVLVATVTVGVSCGLLAWRERPEPGSTPLVVLLAGQCWWSATLVFRIEAPTLAAKAFWVDVSWIGVAVIPVAWLFFSLEYAGYTEFTTRRHYALFSIVPVITVILALTGEFHDLVYVSSRLVQQDGVALLHRTPGLWYWVIAVYTYLLGALGVIPLLQLVSSDIGLFRGQSLALLVGILAPWVTNVLFLIGLSPTGPVDPTPIAFAVSGVAYLGALTRFQLFGANPTPIHHARKSVFERMEQGAIVLDSHDHVVEMNDQAVRALGVPRPDALGYSIDRVCPPLAPSGTGTGPERRTFRPESGHTTYDVSESTITDLHDRTIGRIITLHDIGEFVRQQQRLEVLNRIFRHNVRTSTQVILGNAEYLATRNSERKAATVERNALEIDRISQKVRTIIDVFERGREERTVVSLDGILRDAIDAVEEEYPTVAITREFDRDGIYVDGLFDVVCEQVVRNAAQHNTDPEPRVTVSVEPDGDHATITVADNGPGIDDHELSLLDHGTETPLAHGSGFGLALVTWGTDLAGGTVRFEEGGPTGTVVTIEAPVLPGERG